MFSKTILAFMLLVSTQTLRARELIIISDLDETLKMANVEKKIKAGLKLIKGVPAYEGMNHIFQELKARQPETKFYYLSNSFTFLYNGERWIKRHGFPQGEVLQRCLKDKSDEFKPQKLREIVAAHPDAKFMLFGDNIERDPKFYRELVAELNLSDAEIYIRDARLIFPEDQQVVYFQTEAQITDDLAISPQTAARIEQMPFQKLVPNFLLKNLRQRLVKSCKSSLQSCQQAADQRVSEVIDLIRPGVQIAQE